MATQKRIIETQQGPVAFTTATFREMFPGVALDVDHAAPGELERFGVHPLLPSEPPPYDPETQYLESVPKLIGDAWYEVHEVRQHSAEAVAQALMESKAAAAVTINRLRLEAEAGGFVFRGARIQSDEASMARILSVALGALVAGKRGSQFSVGWRANDNAPVPLDADGVLNMASAMVAAGKAIDDHSQALKAQVAAASTVAEVDAIMAGAATVWPNGYVAAPALGRAR